MRLRLLMAVLVISGCATTPEQTVERGTRYDFKKDGIPRSVASCLARRTDEREGLVASLRDGAIAGSFEVIVRLAGGSGSALSVMRVSPDGAGSRIAIWIATSIGTGEHFANYVTDGC